MLKLCVKLTIAINTSSKKKTHIIFLLDILKEALKEISREEKSRDSCLNT